LVKTYYWRAKSNFGDLLGPLLLKRFAGLSVEWTVPEFSQIVTVGSVLEKLPEDYTGIIAGSGKLHEKTQLNFPNAKILAVRGPLTAKGLTGDFVLGDAALLADELVKREDKQYDLGVIPHWTDTKLEHDTRFTRYDPHIIRVDDDPLEVIREIGRCKKIVSSSLHGIIIADAFGIPRRIEIAPRMLSHPHQEGGLFKWKDYSASIGMRLEVGKTQEARRFDITERQHELYDVFKEIKRIFKDG